MFRGVTREPRQMSMTLADQPRYICFRKQPTGGSSDMGFFDDEKPCWLVLLLKIS